MTRREMQDLLTQFAEQNPEYRDALLRRPKEVIEEQFQMQLPQEMVVETLVETPKKIYLVLPYLPEEGADLSDFDLEAAAGGNTAKGDENCSGVIAGTSVEVDTSLF